MLAIIAPVAVYLYGIERNRGSIPPWIDHYLGAAWGALAFVLFLAYGRSMERRAVGRVEKEAFRLQPAEKCLFTANFMSGEFYSRAEDFSPRPPFRRLLKGPLAIRHLLRIRLTDRRFVVGTILGYAWRSLPLTSIRRVVEIQARWPYRDAHLIEYEFEGKSEAILVWTRSTRDKAFVALLRDLTKP